VSDLPITYREGKPSDYAHIVITWTQSALGSNFAAGIRKNTFIDHHKKMVQRTVETQQILIACDPTDPDLIIGYVVYSGSDARPVVHYVHVKVRFRGFGIGTALLNRVSPWPFTATHNTFAARKLRRKDYDYNPFLFLEGQL
jgi:GNAT superfamily N-acetyltransferase